VSIDEILSPMYHCAGNARLVQYVDSVARMACTGVRMPPRASGARGNLRACAPNGCASARFRQPAQRLRALRERRRPPWRHCGRHQLQTCVHAARFSEARTMRAMWDTCVGMSALSAGMPPFVIQEEFDRYSGLWWSPQVSADSSSTSSLLTLRPNMLGDSV
jgi:Dipeptidyl peptidase IV (DPP IV) N-terminal region